MARIQVNGQKKNVKHAMLLGLSNQRRATPPENWNPKRNNREKSFWDKLPGRVRASGFLASDVDSLIADGGKQNGGVQ
jgi:hypothetical protein